MKIDSKSSKFYYSTRKRVRDLYNNDIKINPRINDLYSRILQIRDKYDCVESISIDTTNYQIEADIDPDSDKESIAKVKSNIISELDNYIDKNKELIGIETYDDVCLFEKIPKLYDDVSLGNNIKINL